MDATDLKFLEKHPEIDNACRNMIRLAQEAYERDGHGTTGIVLMFQGSSKPVRVKQLTELVLSH